MLIGLPDAVAGVAATGAVAAGSGAAAAGATVAGFPAAAAGAGALAEPAGLAGDPPAAPAAPAAAFDAGDGVAVEASGFVEAGSRSCTSSRVIGARCGVGAMSVECVVTITNAAMTATWATPESSDGHEENSEGSGTIGATAGTAASGTSASRPSNALGAPFFSLRRGKASRPGSVRVSVSFRRECAGTSPPEGRCRPAAWLSLMRWGVPEAASQGLLPAGSGARRPADDASHASCQHPRRATLNLKPVRKMSFWTISTRVRPKRRTPKIVGLTAPDHLPPSAKLRPTFTTSAVPWVRNCIGTLTCTGGVSRSNSCEVQEACCAPSQMWSYFRSMDA